MPELKITQIVADPNQPREYFNATKLATLKASIKKHGIRNPITVERQGDHYMIQDGERRFRVAKDLGLETVPVTIADSTTEAERLIIQFHIQEQHEGWLPTEKANALAKIAEAMGVSMAEACELVGMERTAKDRYVAFANLKERRHFQKTETPIHFAPSIISFKNYAKSVYRKDLAKEIPKEMENDLELAIINRIKNGEITRPRDLVRLKDSVKKDPKSLEKFITDESETIDNLFIKSKAQGAYHLRNVYNGSTHLANNIRKFMELSDVKVDSDLLSQIRGAKRAIEEFLRKFDE